MLRNSYCVLGPNCKVQNAELFSHETGQITEVVQHWNEEPSSRRRQQMALSLAQFHFYLKIFI